MPDDDATIAPFTEFLVTHRKGRLHAELSDALNQLNAAVMAMGKGGELSLRIKIAPAAKLDAAAVVVSDEVTLKLPKPDRPTGLWFVDDAGNLRRNDPRQAELPLTSIPGEGGAPTPEEQAQ